MIHIWQRNWILLGRRGCQSGLIDMWILEQNGRKNTQLYQNSDPGDFLQTQRDHIAAQVNCQHPDKAGRQAVNLRRERVEDK